MIDRLTFILVELRRWGLTIAAGLLVVGIGAWWLEHDSRLRQAAQAEILDRQDKLAIQALKNQADTALAAVVNSAAREKQARAALSDQALAEKTLLAQLRQMREAATRDAERHAALSPAEVRAEVVRQLGPDGVGAGVALPLAPSKEGAASRPPTSEEGPASRPPTSEEGAASRPPTSVDLRLTEIGVHKVDQALLDLAACREQDALDKEIIDNCVRQRDSLGAIVAERGKQLDSFQTAMAAQQDLAGTEKAQLERQLQTARGGWLRRTWDRVKAPVMFAAGVGIGLAVP